MADDALDWLEEVGDKIKAALDGVADDVVAELRKNDKYLALLPEIAEKIVELLKDFVDLGKDSDAEPSDDGASDDSEEPVS